MLYEMMHYIRPTWMWNISAPTNRNSKTSLTWQQYHSQGPLSAMSKTLFYLCRLIYVMQDFYLLIIVKDLNTFATTDSFRAPTWWLVFILYWKVTFNYLNAVLWHFIYTVESLQSPWHLLVVHLWWLSFKINVKLNLKTCTISMVSYLPVEVCLLLFFHLKCRWVKKHPEHIYHPVLV